MKAMASRLELELDDGEQRVMKLLEQADAAVKCIRVEYWGGEGGIVLQQEQFETIFAKIGTLPHTKEIILHFALEAPELPVLALQSIFATPKGRAAYDRKEATAAATTTTTTTSNAVNSSSSVSGQVEYLHLHCVKLAGCKADFDAFADTIRNSICITHVHLHSCSSVFLSNESVDNGNVSNETNLSDLEENYGINSLIQSLADLPSLATLHLDDVHHLKSTTLVALCKAPALNSTEIWNMGDVINRHGQAMASILAQNQTSLRELEISSNLEAVAGQSVIAMLRNNTTLHTLGLDIDYVDGFGASLASVFLPEHNTTLKTLHLRLVGNESAPTAKDADGEESSGTEMDSRENKQKTRESKTFCNACTLIEALKHNISLEHLHMNFYQLTPDSVSEALVEPVSELLQTNFVLKNLTLRGQHTFVRLGPELDFLLKLNRAGRYNLLAGDAISNNNNKFSDTRCGLAAPRAEWVEAISNNQNDASIVFYLVSMNPSLCNYG